MAVPTNPTMSPPSVSVSSSMSVSRQTVVSSAAAAGAGVLATVMLQPLEVAKTRTQSGAIPATIGRGVVPVLRHVVRAEGVRGLWSGVGVSAFRVGVGQALYFGMLDPIARAIKAPSTKRVAARGGEQHAAAAPAASTDAPMAPMRVLLAGTATRAAAAVLMNPVQVVKTRMEMGSAMGRTYPSSIHALVALVREERFAGLLKGVGPTLVRDAPYSGLYLLLYERAREYARSQPSLCTGEEGVLTRWASFGVGASCSAIATAITHPPDVVRTRLQLNIGQPRSGPIRLRDGVDAFRTIVRTDGARGLFLGLTPRLVKRALQMGLTWMLVEEALKRAGETWTFR
ncbi:solute carrier family 25, member 38 [Pseudoscourfieldia marina]